MILHFSYCEGLIFFIINYYNCLTIYRLRPLIYKSCCFPTMGFIRIGVEANSYTILENFIYLQSPPCKPKAMYLFWCFRFLLTYHHFYEMWFHQYSFLSKSHTSVTIHTQRKSHTPSKFTLIDWSYNLYVLVKSTICSKKLFMRLKIRCMHKDVSNEYYRKLMYINKGRNLMHKTEEGCE